MESGFSPAQDSYWYCWEEIAEDATVHQKPAVLRIDIDPVTDNGLRR
jgi:predicted phosphoadenosine phosphosulfate sulfurtransferase